MTDAIPDIKPDTPDYASTAPLNLWHEAIDVWQHGFMGVDIGRIIIAITIFGAFMLVRGFFTKYVLNKLHNFTAKTKTNVDDRIVDALIPPIKFIPVIIGVVVAAQYAGLDEILGGFYERVIRSLIAFTIFWALYRAIIPLSHMMNRLERVLSPIIVQWLFKILKVLVVFVGAAVILEMWGIAVGPLLAGLGIFGAAIALGAQDMFKNLIAGLTIIAEKKFQPGDWIKVEGIIDGTVEDIGIRSTEIRRFDKAPVQVPNAQLADAAIINFSRMTHRRIYWMIGVEYRTTTKQLKIIRDEILDYLNNNDAIDKDVTLFVRVDSFNNSSIDFLVYCFTKTVVWGEWLEIKEDLAFKIKEIVEEKAGTGFAFPSQSLYIESLPGDAPENFSPPAKKAKTKK